MTRLAELPDALVPVLILAGVVYPALVWIGHKTGLASVLPPAFTSVGGVAISSLLFGLGLVLAGAKYASLDSAAARFFSVTGWFLIMVSAIVWIRRSQ